MTLHPCLRAPCILVSERHRLRGTAGACGVEARATARVGDEDESIAAGSEQGIDDADTAHRGRLVDAAPAL